MSGADNLTPWTLPDLQLPTARTQNDPHLAASEEWAKQATGKEYAALFYLETACADCNEAMPSVDRARLDVLRAERDAYAARRAPEIAAEWAAGGQEEA